MKANELRIGNWVASMFGKDIEVLGISRHNKIETDRMDEDIDTLKPIPLTEDWLLKFGFEFINEVCGYADRLHIIYQTKDAFIFHPFCTNDKYCQIEIKHVHQLQNLYFALTSEELTIKETVCE